MRPPDDPRNHAWNTGPRLLPAAILIGIGVLFLLHNLNIFYFWEWARYWPAILIAIGLVKLVDSNFTGGRVAGGVLVALGAIFLGQTTGYLNVQIHELWPLFLIGAGFLMLFGGGNGSWHMGIHRGPGVYVNGQLREASVFGGGKRQINTQQFTGGHIDAVFSGFEIDLRGAAMVGDSAVLKVSTVFGGVEIRVPETWSVVIEGHGVFGAFVDNTTQPNLQTPGLKRLVVRGGAVFGGVEVKN